jgi:quercetin dioxygenase-like cupin family protein
MATLQDLIARDRDVVCRPIEAVEQENILTVEGAVIPGAAEMLMMKALIATENVIVLWAARKKGMKDPQHMHADHDTVSTLVSGHMNIHIDGVTYDAKPGTTWRHRPGVKHWSEALEDSLVLEIKTPPAKTW